MLRVKIPYGSVTPDQLDMLGHIAETYSRGWGHLTTRQNVQFHYVQLDDVPAALRDLATTGLITREACGDTVRNVQGCHLAGARSEEHTSELQSLMRTSYAVFCFQKKKHNKH